MEEQFIRKIFELKNIFTHAENRVLKKTESIKESIEYLNRWGEKISQTEVSTLNPGIVRQKNEKNETE